jgi:hypothetical protein
MVFRFSPQKFVQPVQKQGKNNLTPDKKEEALRFTAV